MGLIDILTTLILERGMEKTKEELGKQLNALIGETDTAERVG